MKICRCCKDEKPFHEFYKRASNLDGLYSYCKECSIVKNRKSNDRNKEHYNLKRIEYKRKNKKILSEKAKVYYVENRQMILDKSTEYRKKNKEKISLKEALKRISDEDRFEKNRQKHLSWSKNNRDVLNAYQRDWYQKNKEKRRAHVILNRSIKKGLIMRPETCSECQKICKPDGHHSDYSKPLEVVWLCRACHSRKSPRTVIV